MFKALGKQTALRAMVRSRHRSPALITCAGAGLQEAQSVASRQGCSSSRDQWLAIQNSAQGAGVTWAGYSSGNVRLCNIVEGAGRSNRSEFHQFLEIALASLNELQGHLLLARDSAVLPDDVALELSRHIEIERRMLIALMRTLQEHIAEEDDRRRKKRREQDGNSQTL